MRLLPLLLFPIYLTAASFTTQNGYNNYDLLRNGVDNFLKTVLDNNCKVLFDVGANVGYWSNFAPYYSCKARIHLFEPHPGIFKMLCNRVSCKTNTLNQFALWDCETKATFWVWGNEKRHVRWSESNTLYNRPILKTIYKETPQKIKVQTTTLDQYCQRKGITQIDLLKLTTEGAEWAVLMGSKDMLKNRRIKMIQFEYSWAYKDAKITLKQVFDFLRSQGFTIYRLLPKKLLRIDEWCNTLECYQYSNYAALLK